MKTRLAALEFLYRAIGAFDIPVREAELWIHPADVPWFAEEVEKHVCSLLEFFDEYLAKHPGALQRGDDPENEKVIEQELAYVRKNLGLIPRIGRAGTKADAGKSTALIVQEEIRKAVTGSSATAAATDAGKSTTAVVDSGSTTDFAAEAEELRKLRAGTHDPPPSNPGAQP